VFADLRLIGALGALVTAVAVGSVGWQSAPPAPNGGRPVQLRSTAEPMETTMKSPIVATTDPRPFDPCEDIPFDVVQRLGLALTPPEHEDGLRCHDDAGNYQMAVEAIIWRTYAHTLPADAVAARHTIAHLLTGERVILGDGGYRGIDTITAPARDNTGGIIHHERYRTYRRVRARVEHVIARLKDRQILRQCCRRSNAINHSPHIIAGLWNLKTKATQAV